MWVRPIGNGEIAAATATKHSHSAIFRYSERINVHHAFKPHQGLRQAPTRATPRQRSRKRVTHFSEQALDQLGDCHPARNGVGVNDDVRHDPIDRPGHVLLPVCHPDRTLLPVTRRELVADLGDADVADAHLRTANM